MISQEVKKVNKCNWCNKYHTTVFSRNELAQPINPDAIKTRYVICPYCLKKCGSYTYNKFLVKKSTKEEIESVINKKVP